MFKTIAKKVLPKPVQKAITKALYDPNIKTRGAITQSLPHWFEMVPNVNAKFEELWDEYNLHHGEPQDPVRVIHFMQLLEQANTKPDGDYAEFGSHKGLAAKLIWKLMDPSKKLFLFDTFEGFVEKDLEIERKIYSNSWTEGNFMPTSPEGVRAYVTDGKKADNLIITKGWFPASFAGFENNIWRFVHIDFDLYQPIKECMELVFPKIVPGGIMVVHDYGSYGFPGAKQAVDEFAEKIKLTPVRLADRWGSVVFTKPGI